MLLFCEHFQIGVFASAENLQALPCEGFVKAGKGETRTIEIGSGNLRAASPFLPAIHRRLRAFCSFRSRSNRSSTVNRVVSFVSTVRSLLSSSNEAQ